MRLQLTDQDRKWMIEELARMERVEEKRQKSRRYRGVRVLTFRKGR
jgi:hypothetical protein